MEEKKRRPNEIVRAMAISTALGTEMAICVVAGFYGGRYIDGLLGTGPWIMIVGILLGVAAGTFGIMKILERYMKNLG
ncbi:MAG: AtpZ/AtpI family protein [Bacillota bacterium]|jgi:F0F1-type ATP synthase assembly protein I